MKLRVTNPNNMRAKTQHSVVIAEGAISKENLPHPIVHYPGPVGVFFAFQENEYSDPLFCGCAKEAIEHYLVLLKTDSVFLQVSRHHPNRLAIWGHDFPLFFSDVVQKANAQSDDEISDLLQFGNKLCHECNQAVPTYRYCSSQYGSPFEQHYGWYINKQAYEYGIEPLHPNINKKFCPQEILDLIKLDIVDTPVQYRELISVDREKAKALWKSYTTQKHQIWNIIESEVRLKFGHKRVGEAWSSETILYYIISSLFSGKQIHRHYRPDFMNGLELDIYIEDIKLAIEYQGVQHFEPIEHWGGLKSLKELKKRDKMKANLCKLVGIDLVYFNYDEPLCEDSVKSKLSRFISNI